MKILVKLNLKLIDLMYEWNPAFEFPINIVIKEKLQKLHADLVWKFIDE